MPREASKAVTKAYLSLRRDEDIGPRAGVHDLNVGHGHRGRWRRIRRRAHAEPADLRQHFAWNQHRLRADRFLDNGEQFALQRTMTPLRPLPQALNDVVRAFLIDRLTGMGSEFAPIRISHA